MVMTKGEPAGCKVKNRFSLFESEDEDDEGEVRGRGGDDDELGESCFVETWTHRHGCDSFFAAKLRRRK